MTKLVALIFIGLILLELCVFPDAYAVVSHDHISVYILSPSAHEMNPNPVTIKVRVHVTLDTVNNSTKNRWIGYSLDGQDFLAMAPVYQGVEHPTAPAWPYSVVTAEAPLTNLCNGYHSLTVYATYDQGDITLANGLTIHFAVGLPLDKPPMFYALPTVSLNVSGDPQTFRPGVPIPYTIKVGIPDSWFLNNSHFQSVWATGRLLLVGYMIDGNPTVTANEISTTSNTTALLKTLTINKADILLTGNLPALSPGNHKIQAFITWTDPFNERPQTLNSASTFLSIGDQSEFSAASMVLVAAVLVFAGVGLLVCYRRYKRTHS